MLYISLGAFLGLALIGFLVASQNNENPSGLLKIESLSGHVSESPKWYLPFSVLGICLGFLFNLVVYSFYTLSVAIRYLAIVIKWLYDNVIIVFTAVLYRILMMFVALWKWFFDKLIIPFLNAVYEIILLVLDVLLMVLRIAKHYLLIIPIDILLHSIRAVPPALKWANYNKSFIVVSIGMLCIAIFKFIGFLAEMPLIGDIGLYLSIVALISWVVGLVSFGSHKEGRKAAVFSGTLIGLTIAILLFTFGINQLDDLHGWGGTWAGFWYAPSVLSILIAIFIGITLAFMTSVGAIYANSNVDHLSYKDRITGFAKATFDRAWTFSLQPIFVALVGGILLILPYILVDSSAKGLNEIVNEVTSSQNEQLEKSLNENSMAQKINGLLRDTTISETQFKKCIDTLEVEKDLTLRKNENLVYSDFFSREISKIGLDVSPVMANDSLNRKLENLEKSIAKLKSDEKKRVKEDSEISTQMSDTAIYTKAQLAVHKLQMNRSVLLYNSSLKTSEAELTFKSSCKSKYASTLFFFLIGKSLIFGVLLTIVVNLFGFSTKPIYEMYSQNYLVEEVKAAQSANKMQPWIGLLLIGGLAAFLLRGNSIMGNISFDFSNKTPTEIDKNTPVNELSSDIDSTNITTPADTLELINENLREAPSVNDFETQAAIFTCYDGTEIPLKYFNDGDCDCSSCEDEPN